MLQQFHWYSEMQARVAEEVLILKGEQVEVELPTLAVEEGEVQLDWQKAEEVGVLKVF